MHLTRRQKNCLTALTLCLLLTAAAVTSPVSFAWLASFPLNTTFTVRSSDVSKFESAEVWVYAEEAYDDRVKGWNVASVDSSGTTQDAVRFREIGSFGGTETVTFSPTFLYFGTINNLIQEQANKPVYLKFKIALKKNSTNTVRLDYTTDDDYVSVYQLDYAAEQNAYGFYPSVEVTDESLDALCSLSDYPFLRFRYFTSKENYDISALGDENDPSKPDVFSALFDEGSEKVTEYTNNPDDLTTVFDNTEGDTSAYIYVKISVNSETLAKALTESELKNFMPAYLVFSVGLGLEIRTTAYTGS